MKSVVENLKYASKISVKEKRVIIIKKSVKGKGLYIAPEQSVK
jgi:hypothetical protein